MQLFDRRYTEKRSSIRLLYSECLAREKENGKVRKMPCELYPIKALYPSFLFGYGYARMHALHTLHSTTHYYV